MVWLGANVCKYKCDWWPFRRELLANYTSKVPDDWEHPEVVELKERAALKNVVINKGKTWERDWNLKFAREERHTMEWINQKRTGEVAERRRLHARSENKVGSLFDHDRVTMFPVVFTPKKLDPRFKCIKDFRIFFPFLGVQFKHFLRILHFLGGTSIRGLIGFFRYMKNTMIYEKLSVANTATLVERPADIYFPLRYR